ncbi:MAG: ABC transporter ATP-binding protein, partial [Bacteroidaceae bacterium]|nr:ABC transporter ATP-binding protein [Bacteroidaceae bacterium]
MSLQLNDLLIGYDGCPIAAPVTATLQPGRLACLLGPNGAGKSTLMRTIAGLQKPLGGTLRIAGGGNIDANKIAIVTTERVLTQGLLARDVVELGRSPHTGFFGRLTAEDRDVVTWAAELTGIEALMSRSMATLSDGERQKVM